MFKIKPTEQKTDWISVKITPSMAKGLARAAKKYKVSRSMLLRELIENFLQSELENSEGTPPKNETNLEIFKIVS